MLVGHDMFIRNDSCWGCSEAQPVSVCLKQNKAKPTKQTKITNTIAPNGQVFTEVTWQD